MAASNLTLRIASAAVLAPLALAAAYFGGWPFAIFWTAAAIAVLWEWTVLVAGPGNRLVFTAGAVALVAGMTMTELSRPNVAMLLVALGVFASLIFAPATRRVWVAAGVLYAGVLALAPVFLRDDPKYGLAAVIIVFIVVWTTDIAGYFAGRAIGGPKLAPAISPKKTWSGALAGTLGAVVLATLATRYLLNGTGGSIAVLALMLSAASQAGDLFESGIKRHFDAKDAGSIIPGHGGVMDRLDGFWAAVFLAAVIGIARGGFEAPAQGLLLW